MTHTDRQHCSFTGTDMCGVISDLLLPETVIISNDNNNNYTFLSVLNHYFLLFFHSTYIFKVLYSLSLSLNVCVCVSHWVIAILLHSVCSVLRDPEINIQTHPWAMNLCQPPHLLLSTHSITNTLFGFAYIRSCCGRLEDVSTRLFASIDRETRSCLVHQQQQIFLRSNQKTNKTGINEWNDCIGLAATCVHSAPCTIVLKS